MEKPSRCQGCPLEHKGIGFSQSEGEGSRGILIVGDSLDDEGVRDGLPFRPKSSSGTKLESALKLLEGELLEPVRRGQFKLWNLCACKPPYGLLENMPWEQSAINHCRQAYFDEVVESVRPYKDERVILACGPLALKYLTTASGNAKEKQSLWHLRGYVFRNQYGYVIPTFHPFFIRRGNPNLTSVLVQDIRKAIETARGDFVHRWHPDYRKPEYQEFPSLDEIDSFVYHVLDNPQLTLTYDIETPNSSEVEEDEREDLEDVSTIIQVQFSTGKYTGIAIPYEGPYIERISRLLASPNTKANHNTWKFDNPILKAKSHKIEGRVHDTMWMFKHYQPNLPRGLQAVASLVGFPFPWKHLYGSKLAWYGCADVDAVQWIVKALPPLMKQWGVWQGYLDHNVRLYSPTLERASERGIPVNEDRRQGLTVELTKEKEELNKKLQQMIPVELKNISPKRKDKKTGDIDFGYKREPPGVKRLKKAYDKLAAKIWEDEHRKPKKSFARVAWEQLGVRQATINGERRWVKIKEFVPSFDQTLRYLKWKRKQLEAEGNELAKFYVVPTVPKVDKATGERKEKETTGKQALQDLIYETDDSVLSTIAEYRSISTTISNFIPNWKPDKKGFVHTQWGFTAASGQLDSRRPNILNCSKHTDIGQRFRRIVEAPPGYVFVEMDKKSYHVATMGYLANSKNYIRFSQIDPHSIFTSYIMPKEWGPPVDLSKSDAEIREYCSYIKKRCKASEVDIRQKVAKPTVLGNQLGLGPKKLWKSNRRFIHGMNHAIELQTRLKDVFPEIPRTQNEILERANRQSYLKNDWNRIQWFFDVFVWTYSRKSGGWKRHNGPTAEQALAFMVQSTAFGEIDWNLLEAEERGWNDLYNFCNSIHDSVMYMPRVEDLEACVRDIYGLFCRPCSVLVNEATGPEGLTVGVEVSIGRNWQGYKEDKNPEGMRELSGKELVERFGIAA